MKHKPPLRIDIWTPDPTRTGGVQRYSQGIINGLRSLPSPPEVRVIPLRSSRPLSKILFVIHALFSLFRKRPDVIWCTHLHLAAASLPARLLNIPLWISLHGIECWHLTKPRNLRSLSIAARLFCVSHFTMNQVKLCCPRVEAKLEWLPNHLSVLPPEIPHRKTARIALELPENALILLTVSRLSTREQYKGHREVLQTLPRLREQFPEILYLIAGDGDDAPALRKLANQLDLDSHVSFTGSLSEKALHHAYAASDLFVLAGTGEGFGIAILEALFHGVPVLASCEDGSQEAVCGGRLGWLVSPRQPEAVYQKLRQILSALRSGQSPYTPEFLRSEILKAYGPKTLSQRLTSLLEITS